MDSVDNLILHLPRETKHLFKKLCSSEDYRYDLEDIQEFLGRELYLNPYPTLQILKYHSTLRNSVLGEIVYNGLIGFLADERIDKSDEFFDKFLNYVANFHIEDERVKDVCEAMLERMLHISTEKKYKCYLSLLSRSTPKLLHSYTDVESKQFPLNSKAAILFQALHKKEHFVANIVRSDVAPSMLLDSPCGQILAVVKLVQQLSASNQSSKHMFQFNEDLLLDVESYQESSQFLDAVYYDLNRMANLVEMLKQYVRYELPLSTVISTQPFLDVMYTQTKFATMDFDVACDYVAKNQMFYQRMIKADCRNTELYILMAYQVLSNVCDVYFKNKKDTDYAKIVDNRLSNIVELIQSLEDDTILTKLLQNIFALLFLRWENVSDVIGSDDPLDEVIFNVARDAGRSGFVCNKFLLEKFLNLLLDTIAKRLSHDSCEQPTIMALNELKRAIEDANWRMRFLRKITIQHPIRPTCLYDSDIISLLYVFHDELLEKRTSDDEQPEEGITTNTLTRKRSKTIKKRRNSMPKSVLENYGLTPSLIRSVSSGRAVEDRGMVARMLASPLDLAVLALSREDIEGAREVMKRYNLTNDRLEHDISFFEKLRSTKSQLQRAITKYEKQESFLKSQSTVEHIKKVAGIGFETSRITNITEDFAHTNFIVPDADQTSIIEKYCSTYPFLRQYENGNLQICIILDLILNLNMNHELSSNLLNMTNRLYNSDNFLDELSNSQDSYRILGSVYFFNNLVQCLHHYKTISRENLGVKQLLCNTFLTLRSDSLKSELEKEHIFKMLFKKSVQDVQTVKSLKTLSKSFEELKTKTNFFSRFTKYISNMAKLIEIISAGDPPENILQILNTDMRSIVGSILFEKHISPSDIENLIYSLNVNLVHTIALNVCPMIERKTRISTTTPKMHEFSDELIRAYVYKQNTLLCYLLKHVSDRNRENASANNSYFLNAMTMPEVEVLSKIYDGNLTVACLLFDHLEVEELKNIPDISCLISIYKIARQKFNKTPELEELANDTIKRFIRQDISQIQFIENIKDLNDRVNILLENIVKIKDADLATCLIKSILMDDRIATVDQDKRERLERFLKDIYIFSQVASDFMFQTWCTAYIFGQESPLPIMKKLIKLKKYELCCEWWQLHNSDGKLSMKPFYDSFFSSLIQIEKNIDSHLLKIIESFPVDEVIDFFDTHIEKFRRLPVLKYVVNYLFEHSTHSVKDNDENSNNDQLKALKYLNFKISLNIFSHMTHDELEQNWGLISRPLLMIEQFVMSSRFEALSKILGDIRPVLSNLQTCKYCSDHSEMIYEIPMNSSITLGNPKNSAYILLNINLYKTDHVITMACIDTLLQIYATKALDYRINESQSSNDPTSLSTEMASLDSLCGTFVMPKEAPTRDNWIRDDEASQCMCCKRAIFTMLTRRHHCRRCGRVVCYSCSTNRLKIPKLYEDIAVRVCNDCFKQTQALETKTTEKTTPTKASDGENKHKSSTKENDWQLSGNLTHDKLLREEFSYEHAPSTHLCLSILSFHSNNTEYVNLLLHHCRKFERLLRPIRPGYPNPEIDYALVAKMLNCLALAAKVRGGPPECDTIRDHSEIIISTVQNGCEAFLPTEPINNQSLRKLGDAMVLAEKWPLALDIYLKCGHSTAGVMAAYGLACLRAGRYETAREQLLHCMTRLCKSRDIPDILKFITTEHELDVHSEIDIPTIKRPIRSPALLGEIIKVIESSSKQTHVPETLARADSIRNSNTSLASTKSKPKDKIPIIEPAMNIMNTISNLKQISQGKYCDSPIRKLDNKKNVIQKVHMFEECLYYLLSYGSHMDIVNFLIRHDQTMCALRYFILQNLDNEIFIKAVYVKHLKRGRVDYLIRQMTAIDSQLSIWKDAIIQTCRYLETKNLLNCLYHLQILLNDPIRASMTCVKFYSMNCSNFRDLQNNSFHLINAQKHLQSELEMCQWENINLNKKRPVKEPSFLMQMDAKTLNCHINTILRQLEVTKFLAKAEQDEKGGRRSTKQILKQIGVETISVPTLFDSIQERIQICILVLLCGNNVEEGFGLAYRIIQDYNLPAMKVYTTTAKCLARNCRLAEVRSLINCIKSNNGTDQSEYDKILSLAVNTATNTHMPEIKAALDDLTKMISDIGTRISCHIYVGQLKSAYLLAVQHNRLNDIMKILSQAEATNQIHIVRLCEKKLNIKQM